MMAGHWRINGFYDVTKLTGLFEAAQRRESCRSFAAAPSTEQWNALTHAADELALPGVRIALGLCDTSLFKPLLAGLVIKFENVQRFAAVIVRDREPQTVVDAGVSGEMFLLRAVELGLGACWVSGTYKRGQVGLRLEADERIVALLALGIPKRLPDLPIRRRRKEITALCPAFDSLNSAQQEIVQYVQIAPSAINLQPWRISPAGPSELTISVGTPGQRLDLGIGLCHALLALGSTPAQFSLGENALSATVRQL